MVCKATACDASIACPQMLRFQSSSPLMQLGKILEDGSSVWVSATSVGDLMRLLGPGFSLVYS